MIRNIPKPDITPAFTVDDIHKIRAWHYERLRDAAPTQNAERQKVAELLWSFGRQKA